MAVWVRYAPQLVLSVLLATVPAALTGVFVWQWQQHKVKDARHALDSAIAKADRQRLVYEQNAREAERFYVGLLSDAAQAYEMERQSVEENHRRVVDDLERGAVRLRAQWQGCEATARLSADAAATRHVDEVAQLRAESAARIVRVGAECDAHVRALQDVVRVYVGRSAQ